MTPASVATTCRERRERSLALYHHIYHVGNEFVAVGKGFGYHQYRGPCHPTAGVETTHARVFAYGASAMDFLYFSLSTEFIALLDACICVHSSF
jgi:hypothetical protein